MDIETVRKAFWGKSHYFDTDTVRYFGARYGSWRTLSDRIVVCVESISQPRWGIPRTYRVLVIDLKRGKVARFNNQSPEVRYPGTEYDWKTGSAPRRHVRAATLTWARKLLKADR